MVLPYISADFNLIKLDTMPVKLIIILPCYNEESILKLSFEQLRILFDDLTYRQIVSKESKICFVDDGSKDKTWQIIEDIQSKHSFVSGDRKSVV